MSTSNDESVSQDFSSPKQRVLNELSEVHARGAKLAMFINGEHSQKFKTLSSLNQELLNAQLTTMQTYITILKLRLVNWED